MSGAQGGFKELNDTEYTWLRKRLLREKGSDAQREFLREVRDGGGFLERLSAIGTVGTVEAELVSEPMTENEFKEPPADSEKRLYESWAAVEPATACRSTFWANVTLQHVLKGRIEAVYLAANGGNLPGGAERIDSVLHDTSERGLLQVDSCVRAVLRRLGGLPEIRGNRSVYVDCPFARAWWRERMVEQASRGEDEVAAAVRRIIRISQTYWEKLVDRIVFRNSTFGSENIRNAFVRALAEHLGGNPSSELSRTDGLQRLCRRASAYQGARELSVLTEAELDEACMVKNIAPKKGRFDKVIKDVFKSGWEEGDQDLTRLLQGYEKALNFLSQIGVATGDLLPSVPALHVLTALQDDLHGLEKASNLTSKANKLGTANRLISAYLWRSFFTERYRSEANDRLFEDYKGLKNCIKDIRTTGALGSPEKVPIFRARLNPLPSPETLGDLDNPQVPWITGSPRLGRAIAAISLSKGPIDWATNDSLDAIKLRELKSQGKLHRHHIFPRKILQDAGMAKPLIYHGLNGVVLSKPTNSEFSRKPPADYLNGILKAQPGLRKTALRERVESHLVPYDLLVKSGDVKIIYQKFIERRAALIANKIAELAEWPGGQG